MIQHSEGLQSIMAAILAVQKDVDHVEKGSTNPHFGNTYADLNTFLHALRGPMADHGIVMTQGPGMENGHVTVDTMLYHTESGEWLRDRAAAPMQKDDPQGVGSAITYLRRYSLAALFAVPQEDDDGNAASRTPKRNGRDRQPAKSKGGSGPTCPSCGTSEVWDNRAKKEAGKFKATSPDYTCKDKEGCGWTLWLDGAVEKIEAALDHLLHENVIDQAERDIALQKAQTGDLDKVASVNEYIREKRTHLDVPAGTAGA